MRALLVQVAVGTSSTPSRTAWWSSPACGRLGRYSVAASPSRRAAYWAGAADPTHRGAYLRVVGAHQREFVEAHRPDVREAQAGVGGDAGERRQHLEGPTPERSASR